MHGVGLTPRACKMTTAIRLPAPEIDQAILEEATDWLVLLQSGEATSHDRDRLRRWCERSAAHQAAWQRAEGILATFQQVPSSLGRNTLSRLPRHGRRQLLALLTLAVPGAWLALRHAPWQAWTAELRTGTGEQKALTLADGSRLVLNTATSVDVAFSATERRITLFAGEIFITTAPDASTTPPRPFVVSTQQGVMQPLGTRFNVRQLDDVVRVAVFEGAVEVRTAVSAQTAIVPADKQLAFSADQLEEVQAADPSAALWERGMLLASDMRLGELIHELGRYHQGVLRCDPAVAKLLVSGAFPVADTRKSLALLEQTLPVRIGSATPYWITVHAR